MEARIADIPIPFARTLRPELDALGPELVFGYSAYIDIPMLSLGSQIVPGSIDVVFYGDGCEVARLSVVITAQALGNIEAILGNRIRKREFTDRNVRWPLRPLDGCQAPSALPADWTLSPKLSDKIDRTSANEYGSAVVEFLQVTKTAEGFCLDAGAGLRKTPYPNVISMDIYDYPSTDLLGIGEDLPFYDNTFEAVLSIAVLEHVKNPFVCAKELIRVTKPGGNFLHHSVLAGGAWIPGSLFQRHEVWDASLI